MEHKHQRTILGSPSKVEGLVTVGGNRVLGDRTGVRHGHAVPCLFASIPPSIGETAGPIDRFECLARQGYLINADPT